MELPAFGHDGREFGFLEVKKSHVAAAIERQLVEIKGELISETIIEERK